MHAPLHHHRRTGIGCASRAGLDDVRIHDLRHSYASRALAAGESLSMIGKLLGHADIQSTARYAHLARETERLSAARVGGSIGADIGADQAEQARTARPDMNMTVPPAVPCDERSRGASRAGDDLRPHRGGALLPAERHRGLGPGAHRLRCPGLSLGRQGLRGADPGARKVPGASAWAATG